MDPKQRSIADQLMAQRRDLLQNQPAALDATGYMNAPEAQARMTIMAQRMAYGESVDRIFNKLWAEHQLALPEGFQLKPLTREDKILVSRMAAAGMRTPDVTGDGLNAKRSGNAGLSLDAPDLSARAPASADKPDNLTMRVDDAVARAGTVTDFGASTNSPLAAQDGISASLREAGIAVPPDATVVDLPSGRVVPKPSSGRGATGAGAGTGIAMTVLGAVMRNAEGGSMDRAEQVGGEQLRTEQAAANADLWVATADGALAAIVGAEKAREVLKPKAAAAVRPGMSASGTAARVLGPASILLAAGWTATEVNAARAAQDGSREASTLYGFLGGVGGGLVGGAGGGAVTGGPWGALIGGVLGGVGGGYMASEAGRESALGDQIQRNHDRESQLAVDQAIVRLQQMGRQFQSTGGLRERDERDLRTIVPALVEQYRRLQVLPIPTSDVDGGLRRNFQMRQIGDALDFLQGEKSATVLITSTQANQNALQQLPAIAAGLNANPQWRALFDYDKDGSVSQQDVRRTVAQQPGLNFAIMDIDGNGLRASEVASTLETIQRFRMENPRFRSAQDIALEYAIYRPFREFWAAEVHGNLNSEQELEAALGALNIPGMTGAELMAVIREYQIPTQALDPAKTGELSESFLVAAFDAYGAPREYMNGLVQNIIKLVPDLSESGGTPRDVTVDTLDMLRDTVEQSNAYQRAGQEEQFIELRAQAAEIARIFLVEGGSREKTSKQYSGHSLLVTRRESLEEAGMIAVFDTDGDNKISREERWSGIYKLGPRNPIGGGTLIPDLDGTFTVDIHEIYLALTPEQRELIDMEKYGNYVRAEAARLDKITTPVEYKAPEPVAETPVPENVSGEPIVIVQSRPSLPKRIIQQLAEAGVTNFVDANNDDVIQSRELVKALKGVKTSESDIDNFLEDGKLNRDVITRLQEASRRQER
jgi:Ca2+-binding EF-hand superfamily protein